MHGIGRIGDLVRLKKLRKLSVNIGSETVIREGEFANFKEIQCLCSLTISWGVVKIEKGQEDSMKSLSFPPKLSKLDIRCIPQGTPPEWLKPRKLEKLEKLYIKGGNLSSLDHEETNEWTVEILLLQYLKKLEITKSEVLEEFPGKLFPRLRYLEKVECGKIEGNEDDIVWEWNKDRG
ncbi:hypothetical protein L1049_025359 [Liquidambar formosana]|uniref:R13L1/DRL21-like LRR repeat region domain-containing protein n=1 Tax=Liquidambar formosana TaxID=63359 RepID=A0AAP0N6P1_LIQFO